MSFKSKKYTIIRKAISKELADFCYNYFLIKRSVADTFYTTKYLTEKKESGEYGMIHKFLTRILIILISVWKHCY